ncbi:SDR family NAD(P)-dependent oxidoreductase [Legionella taurinensis]|uniref:SDR family NAD(P)-dependent oxidoreductase n=1 Tax=Legionella taurinensis TaxID=70611 RepID=A0A3A5L4F6_9GAMM|nr:SDR family NAD(P)-dependent oxidoreductase [Legionella taurinensis]RJT44151.1 SDR family NAD(P)-dependent oxidoreductase [Legionella taurinensis]RJT64919.1 SDR family NAD(P)-dependent oxidoreductase [Legionella taurinensis]STY26570.1 3-oxoacyl-ACP reductase [Legionella taurinensis]
MNKRPLALITGGSSGLGLQFAKNLAQAGYSILIIARDTKKLGAAVEAIKATGSLDVIGFTADISDYESFKPVIHHLKTHRLTLDFLIINAGIAYVSTLQESDINKLREVLNINLLGSMLSTKVFLDHMTRNKKAKILFISSAAGLVGLAGYTAYGASKAGLINFASALRRELLGHIAVYVACPGDIDTPQYASELTQMPDWMKTNSARSAAKPVEVIAARILKKCRQKKFEIYTNNDIFFLLSVLPRFLPRKLFHWIADHLLPRP